MINKDFLHKLCMEQGLKLNQKQLELFDIYAQTLVEWNEKINLTAITQPDDIVVKHFADSLLLLNAVTPPQGCKMIDVGTGAGFPSVPVKIAREDIKLTLLDSLNKRINFLTELSKALELETNAIHSRAEDGGRKTELREKFDIATARAVAHLRELSEYCLPFVKVGGYFVALKGYEIENEMEEAKKAICILGGQVERVEKYTLGEDNKRAIVVIKKVAPTPVKYPRQSGKIAKCPLN